MKNSSSKPMGKNIEIALLTRIVSTKIAIVVITVVLFIIPWIIYQYIPAISATQGYTGESFCANPYVYKILISIAAVLSVFSLMLSRLLAKGSSQWKVFMIFEGVILLNTFIAVFLNTALCDGRSWNLFL